MNKNVLWIVIIIIVLGGLFLSFGGEAPDTEMDDVTKSELVEYVVVAVTHPAAGMPEQDVFIESADDPSMVMRVEQADIDQDATLLSRGVFSAAEAVEHDPFKLGKEPLGPFAKGESLSTTLGEWLAATAEGTYSVADGEATIDLTMNNLVPSGVYTVWCSRIKLPPEPVITDTPCGNPDGSENVVTASEDGSASYSATSSPLEESTALEVAVIALAYHSDGQTYGSDPGAFGKDTHVQVFWIMPAPETMDEEEMMEDDGSDDEVIEDGVSEETVE